jgi:hypothetical protein
MHRSPVYFWKVFPLPNKSKILVYVEPVRWSEKLWLKVRFRCWLTEKVRLIRLASLTAENHFSFYSL